MAAELWSQGLWGEVTGSQGVLGEDDEAELMAACHIFRSSNWVCPHPLLGGHEVHGLHYHREFLLGTSNLF